MKKIFLCYRHDDAPDMAGWVFDRLSGHFGVENVFKDVHKIKPGEDFREALANAVQQCDAIVLIIGKSWLEAVDEHGNRRLDDPNDYVRIEIRSALERGVRLVPVLVHGAAPPKPDELPEPIRELAFRQAAILRGDPDFQHDMDRLCRSLDGDDDDEEVTGAGGEEESEEPKTCPYRGLGTFRSEHAEFFFGRESLVERMLGKLRTAIESEAQSRFLAIVGASGSGKSSLAQAGLIPGLTAGGIQGSSEWPIVVCRPGRNPLENLAVALVANSVIRPAVTDVGELIERLEADQRRLHLTARVALQGRDENQHVVLLVDQFEELFTLCSQDDLRKAFLDNLLFAASSADGNTIVVITMRADFYVKASAFPELAGALSDHQVLVGPMTEDELRLAIERPAELVGTDVESGLAEMLIQDTRRQPGSLPFLQDALRQLWERRGGRRLTVEDYNAIGRLDGAIESRANEVFEKLSETEQTFCRQIFLRLVQPGEGTEDTKRSASWKELADSEPVSRTLQALVNARLLTAKREGEELEAAFVEVSHEALIRGWSRLHQWVEEDREWLKIQHQLTEAANEWNDHNCDPAFLYRGARLEIVEEWADKRQINLNRAERDFLSASVKLRESEEQEKLLAAARLRRRAWIAATAAVVAVSLAGLAFFQAHRAREARAEAQKSASEAARERRFAQSQTKSLEAQEKREADPTTAAELVQQAFLQTLDANEPPPKSAFDALRELREYVDEAAEHFALGETDRNLISLVTPDDRWLVVQSPDNQVHLWYFRDSQSAVYTLHGHNSGVRYLTATSQWLITMGLESDVRIWRLDTADRDPTRHGLLIASPTLALQKLVCSPDGRWLLGVSGNATFRLWDLKRIASSSSTSTSMTLESSEKLPSDITDLGDISFDRFGQWLAVAFQDRSEPALWKLGDFPRFVRLRVDRTTSRSEYSERVYLRFTADGQWLQLQRQQESRQKYRILTAYDEEIALAMDNAGNQGASSLSVWNLSEIDIDDTRGSMPNLRDNAAAQDNVTQNSYEDRSQPQLPEVSPELYAQTAQYNSAKYLVTFNGRACKVWNADPASPELLQEFKKHVPIAISPSGRWLAIHNGEAVALVDLSKANSGNDSLTNLVPLQMLERPGTEILFSKDEKQLVTLSERGNVRVWRLDDAAEPTSHDLKLYDTPAVAMDLSPSGHWLVVMGRDFTRVWDLRDVPSAPRDIRCVASGLRNILFTRQGDEIIITDGWSARVLVPDSEEEQRFFSPPWKALASTPDGRLVALAEEGQLQLWDFAKGPLQIATLDLRAAILDVQLSPNGEFLSLLCDDGRLQLWRIKSLNRQDARILEHDRAPITAITFTPDSQSIVAGGVDGSVWVWPLEETGQNRVVLTRSIAGICALAISPDSKWLVARALDDTGTIWPLQDKNANDKAVTWNSKTLVPGSSDVSDWSQSAQVPRKYGNAAVWNEKLSWIARTIAESRSFPHGEPPRGEPNPPDFGELFRRLGETPVEVSQDKSVASDLKRVVPEGFKASWFPGDTKLAFGATRDSRGRYTLDGGVGIRTIDLATGTRSLLSERGKDPAVSPDGSQILCVDQAVLGSFSSETIWLMTPEGKNVWRLGEGTFPSWSGDGTAIYYHSRADRTIYRQEAREGGQRTAIFERPALEYFAVSPDGTMVAYGNYDGTFRIVDANTRRIVHSFWLPQRGYLPAWCPNPETPQVAFGGYNGAGAGLYVYDLKSQQLKAVAPGNYTMPSWSVDGKSLACDLRSSDGKASIWTISADALASKPWSKELLRLPEGDLLPEVSTYLHVSDLGTLTSDETWRAEDYDDSTWSEGRCELPSAGGTEPQSPTAERDQRMARFRLSFPRTSLESGQSVLLSIRCPGKVRVFFDARLVLESGESSDAPTEWIKFHLLEPSQFDSESERHQLAVEVEASSYGDPLKLFDCTVGQNGIASLSKILGNSDYPLPVRLAAIGALGSSQTTAEGVVDAIMNVFEGSTDVVLKREAIRALPGRLKDQDLTHILLNVMDKPEASDVKRDVFESLGKIGPGAKDAVDVLVKHSFQGDSDAIVALLRIAPDRLDSLAGQVPSLAASRCFTNLIDSARKILFRADSAKIEREWALAALETAEKLEGKMPTLPALPDIAESYLPRSQLASIKEINSAKDWRLTLLGIAQYRMDRFSEATVTLERALYEHGGWPIDLAFLSLCHLKQGTVSEAQAKLTAARVLLKTQRWVKDANSNSAVREALQLLEATSESDVRPDDDSKSIE